MIWSWHIIFDNIYAIHVFDIFLVCNYARICSVITKNSKQNNCDNTSRKKYIQLTNKQWKCWIIEWICTRIHFKVHFRSPYDKIPVCKWKVSTIAAAHNSVKRRLTEFYCSSEHTNKGKRKRVERERERPMQFGKIERERAKYVLKDPLGSLQKHIHKIPNSLGMK